ncbi:MAG: protein phosphatase 2C domain-containing protein [Xanthomonadales bacterium]|nr:protein phosphatase 2C domain-containing protein [Xanthomonadales bacterium]
MIQYGHGSHRGHKRLHNEDTYLADPGLGLWLVADGMGGHANGEVASALARDEMQRAVAAGADLETAIRQAAERISRRSRDPSQTGILPMGTTIAAVQVDESGFNAAWVGDSRIYLWDGNGQLKQISRDHSYVEHLVQKGALTPSQARTHPQRNVVTQALGVTDRDFLQIAGVSQSWARSMQLLICSDGLTEELDDEQIAGFFASDDGPQETVDQLIHAALHAGGSDNITVLVLRNS